MGILALLLRKDIMTAPELAEHFEVSGRTINRIPLEVFLERCQGGSMLLTTDGDLFKVTLIFPVVRETEHDPFFDMY